MKPREFVAIRGSLGLTQKQMATLLLVRQSAVSRWESGDRTILPRMAEWIRIRVRDHRQQHAA